MNLARIPDQNLGKDLRKKRHRPEKKREKASQIRRISDRPDLRAVFRLCKPHGVDATALYWPAKARALSEIAGRSVAVVAAWAASLGLAQMPAAQAATTIRHAVADRVEYRAEVGDRFDGAQSILVRGHDDCDGHAVIGAALGAAAGHRARIVGVSLDGVQPEHVRAEIGDASGWYSADSTGPDRAAVLHAPVALIDPPRPVGGLFDRIGRALAKVRDWIGDFGHWINGGTALRDIWDFVTDIETLASVAAIAGCTVATSGAGALACQQIGASKMAWAVVAAESWSAIGPGRWRELSERARDERIQAAEQALGREEMAARMAAAERIAMSEDPDVAMARDPQIAHDVIDIIIRSGRPETRQKLWQYMPWRNREDDEQAVAVVLRMLRHHGLITISQDTRRAFDQALRASSGRIQARIEAQIDAELEHARVMAECPPIPGDVVQHLIAMYGNRYREVWCRLSPEDRRQGVNRVRGECPPIPEDVAHLIALDAWCENHQRGRNEMVARARTQMGVIGPDMQVPETVAVYLGIKRDVWGNSSMAQRQAWRREAAVMAIADRRFEMPTAAQQLTPGQLDAVRDMLPRNRAPAPRSAPAGGGGGGAVLGLFALFAGGMLFRK